MATKYLTLSNLSTFLSTLKSKYSANTENGDFQVNYAQRAINDKNGKDITSTYHTVEAFNTFKTAYDTFEKDTKAFTYNKIHSISLKGSKSQTATTIEPDGNKNIEIDLSGYALLTDVTSVLQFKGTLKQYTNLPGIGDTPYTDTKIGDVYLLETGLTYDDADSTSGEPEHTDKNVEYVCVGFDSTSNKPIWEKIGSAYDFSAYAEKTYVDAEIKKIKETLSGDTTTLEKRVKANEDKLAILNSDANTTDSVAYTATSIVNAKIATLDFEDSSATTVTATDTFVTSVTETDGIIAVNKATLSVATDTDIAGIFT